MLTPMFGFTAFLQRIMGKSLFGFQVMCFYFVFTVFSTVGFGDIFAVNTPERVRASNLGRAAIRSLYKLAELAERDLSGGFPAIGCNTLSRSTTSYMSSDLPLKSSEKAHQSCPASILLFPPNVNVADRFSAFSCSLLAQVYLVPCFHRYD